MFVRRMIRVLPSVEVVCALLFASGLQAQRPCPPSQLASPAANPASPPCEYSYTFDDRLKDYAKRTVGPRAFLTSGVVAGIQQARNAPSAWGQGGEGYGRRYGSSFGGRVISSTVQLGVEPILGEDSRYFASPRRGFWPRMKDALGRSLLVSARNGGREPPIGRLAGTLGSGLISRAWQPDGHRGIGVGLRCGSISFGAYVGSNLFREATRTFSQHLPF